MFKILFLIVLNSCALTSTLDLLTKVDHEDKKTFIVDNWNSIQLNASFGGGEYLDTLSMLCNKKMLPKNIITRFPSEILEECEK